MQSLRLAGFLDPLAGMAARDDAAARLVVSSLAQALVQQTADGMVPAEVRRTRLVFYHIGCYATPFQYLVATIRRRHLS